MFMITTVLLRLQTTNCSAFFGYGKTQLTVMSVEEDPPRDLNVLMHSVVLMFQTCDTKWTNSLITNFNLLHQHFTLNIIKEVWAIYVVCANLNYKEYCTNCKQLWMIATSYTSKYRGQNLKHTTNVMPTLISKIVNFLSTATKELQSTLPKLYLHNSNNHLSRRSIQVLFSLYSIVFNPS